MNSAHKMVLQSAFLLLTFVSMSNSAEILLECDKDSDCGEDYFCSLTYCERCIPCEIHFNRRSPLSPSGAATCARFEDDCGSCLPGYQALDLTNQRRSMVCFPLAETESTFTSPSFSWTGLLWIAAIIFVTMALVVCFLKCRSRTHPVVKEEAEHELISPVAPPLYASLFPESVDETDHLIGSVRQSERISIQVEEEHCNRAVPIDYCDSFSDREEEYNTEMHDTNMPVDGEVVDETSNNGTNDSTETIPSFWEPTPSITSKSMNLVRSLSLELPRARSASANELVRLASDPALSERRRMSIGGESYSHRHVRLSQYRLESQSLNVSATEEESCPAEDLNRRDSSTCSTSHIDSTDESEPEAPKSFSINDDNLGSSLGSSAMVVCPYQVRVIESGSHAHFIVPLNSGATSGQGSQDSGFQDQSRRRQRTTEELVEVNLSLSMKRRRRNYSENE